MRVFEWIGLVATVFVLISFTRSKNFEIRVINTVGSILFIIYGILIHAPSVYILNFCCMVVNIYRLYSDRGYFDTKHKHSDGAIVLGYPCIGKSTLASQHQDCIDLESSNFDLSSSFGVDMYWNAAVNLKSQGYIVFISTHQEIQNKAYERLGNSDTSIFLIYPSIKLKKHWINKCRFRADVNPSTKNKAALNRVRRNYDSDIAGISNNLSKLDQKIIHRNSMCIQNVDYDVEFIYYQLRKRISKF